MGLFSNRFKRGARGYKWFGPPYPSLWQISLPKQFLWLKCIFLQRNVSKSWLDNQIVLTRVLLAHSSFGSSAKMTSFAQNIFPAFYWFFWKFYKYFATYQNCCASFSSLGKISHIFTFNMVKNEKILTTTQKQKSFISYKYTWKSSKKSIKSCKNFAGKINRFCLGQKLDWATNVFLFLWLVIHFDKLFC